MTITKCHFSIFFVNLQLGFVFVVLNLFGEKRKKKINNDDYRKGVMEVKLSVHVIFCLLSFDCR